MLVELGLENLGVIDRASVQLGEGFTVVTGETGAGKTMLVEAIALVVGGRADASMVRPGAEEARVEARFVTTDADATETETVLCRVVAREGRSRAYVDGRMATVSQLAEVGADLVDMHGQHSHQRLLTATAQRAALDRWAGIDLAPLRRARERVTQVDADLAALGGDERSRAREIDLLRFQVEHISPVNLVLEERLLPELLQDQFTPEAVVEAALPLLENPQARDAVADGYRRLRERLGEPGVTRRAAAAILDALPVR